MNYLIGERSVRGELIMELKQFIDRYQIAFQNIYRSISEMMEVHVHADITTDQFTTLQLIHKHEKLTSTEIANLVGVGKSAITAIVNRLVQKDLIQRNRYEKDRRIVYLSLTNQGVKIVNKTEQAIHQYITHKLAHFSIDEIEGFLLALEKLAKLMKED